MADRLGGASRAAGDAVAQADRKRSPEDIRREARIVVTDEAISVANGGRPFSRIGVIALCASDLTEKSEKASDIPDDIPGVPNDRLIDAICQRTIATYNINPNRAKSDARREREVSRDYRGRYLWELIQNADDAMGQEGARSELIGTKGLGFKSVLEVTGAPEIYSGAFAFRFSAKDASERLFREGISLNPAALAFELPFPSKPSAEVRELLEQGFATVVRLPFRNAEMAEKVAKDVIELDHRFLLFSQNLTRLSLMVGGSETTYSVKRSSQQIRSGKVTITANAAEGRRIEQWRRWSHLWAPAEIEAKRLSVAVCLPMNDEGITTAVAAEHTPIFAFFPTQEVIGARALIHVSFDLEQNRKHFREGEHDEEILGEVHKLMTEVLDAIPCAVALDAFGGIEGEASNGPSGMLGDRIRSTLIESEFVPVIGGGKVTPPHAKIWGGRLGDVLREDQPELRVHALVIPALKDSSKVLTALGAKSVEASDYIEALQYCKNATLSETKTSFDAAFGDGLAHLRKVDSYWKEGSLRTLLKVPCWWTAGGSAQGIFAPPSMLWERQKDWPSWLPAHSLSPEMRVHVNAFVARLEEAAKASPYGVEANRLDEWRSGVAPYILRSPADFLHKALVPAINKWDGDAWSKKGWDILEWVATWGAGYDFSKVKPLAYTGSHVRDGKEKRQELSRVIRVPTKKGWISAGDCYAGRSWGGFAYFDKLTQQASRRAVMDFRGWKKQTRRKLGKDHWMGLLRHLGVSWEPKLIKCWNWPVDAEYRAHLSEYNRIDHDWYLEHFPDCLEGERSARILSACFDLAGPVWANPAGYKRYRAQYSEAPSGFKSFAQFQLLKYRWVPQRGCLLYEKSPVRPYEAFLPECGIVGVVPEVDLHRLDDKERARLSEWLESIGVHKSLPAKSDVWLDWIERLGAKGEKEITPEFERAARRLYGRYLGHKLDGISDRSRLKLAGHELRNGKPALVVAPPYELYWVDQPEFETPEVRRALMQHKLKLFVLRLKEGRNAPQRLRVKALSKSIEIEPIAGAVVPAKSEELNERFKQRRQALAAVAGRAADVLDGGLRFTVVETLDLRLRDMKGSELARLAYPAWHSSGEEILISAEHKRIWQSMATSVARWIVKDDDLSSAFELLFLAESDDEVVDRLRQNHVSDDKIRHIEAEYDEMRAAKKDIATRRPAAKDVATDKGGSADRKISAIDAPPGAETQTPPASRVEPQVPHRTPEARPPREAVVSQPKSLPASEPREPPAPGSQGRGQEAAAPAHSVSGDPSRSRRVRPSGWPEDRETLEKGIEAEDWLYSRLCASFPDCPVSRRDRDVLNRESDFVLTRNGEDFHIEAKRVGTVPGAVYWSKLEIAKAMENPGKYFMAILEPAGSNYSIRWIWDPLAQLASEKRRVEWLWQSRVPGETLPAGKWEPLEESSLRRAPDRHVVRIEIGEKLISSLEQESHDLPLLKGRTD